MIKIVYLFTLNICFFSVCMKLLHSIIFRIVIFYFVNIHIIIYRHFLYYYQIGISGNLIIIKIYKFEKKIDFYIFFIIFKIKFISLFDNEYI